MTSDPHPTMAVSPVEARPPAEAPATVPDRARRVGGSFRDPAGFMFRHGGRLYRQVSGAGAADYAKLMASGLYEELVAEGLLVAHAEVEPPCPLEGAEKVLLPDELPFISHPFEWSFGQLKDAALATLEIQRRALARGMVLKDASAYNIQFVPGAARPVLIDTLSLTRYEEGQHWEGYRQFCQHFLAPLALMAHTDVRLGQLLRNHLDGIPLDLAAKLLPRRTKFNSGLLLHLHALAKFQRRYEDSPDSSSPRRTSQNGLLGIIGHLERTVRNLKWAPVGTEWADYYAKTNYEDAAMRCKQDTVTTWLKDLRPGQVWDLGANTGLFSRIAADIGATVLAFDVDPGAVERHHRHLQTERRAILPLLMDLTDPSPGLGWANREREGITERGRPDCVLALALIHHLAIGNNVPLAQVARYFASMSRHAVVEFVPKGDSQVDRMLKSRRDVFADYHEAGFRAAVSPFFHIVDEQQVEGSARTLFLLRRRES